MIFLWRKLVVNHKKGRDMNIKNKLIGAAVAIVGALGFVSCGTTQNAVNTYEVVTDDGQVITVSKEEYDQLMKERQFREERERAKRAQEEAERRRRENNPPALVYGPPPTF